MVMVYGQFIAWNPLWIVRTAVRVRASFKSMRVLGMAAAAGTIPRCHRLIASKYFLADLKLGRNVNIAGTKWLHNVPSI